MIPRYSRARNGFHLVPGNQVPHLVRNRSPCLRCAGKARGDPGGGRADDLGKGGAATFDVARIDEIEAVTKHDVIAFLTHLAEIVGPDARFVHQGMTSSDVLDTCFNVQLVRATDLLLADMDKLLAALKRRAFEHKDTVTIGRSHGIHAEPTTFGVKLALAYAEFDRCRARLVAAREEVATCAISGAVGTFANIDPRVEEHVAAAMGLKAEPVSTQVIPRDRHAMYFATLGVVASCVERLATEIRHLQRTEVLGSGRVFLPRPEGLVGHAAQAQPGADRKPHRPCPDGARLCHARHGECRPLHERDISHSSVERMIGPDATVTLDFALARLTGVIDKLLIYPDNMLKNMNKFAASCIRSACFWRSPRPACRARIPIASCSATP